DCSYGFRPRKSCHDAIKAVGKILETKKTNYIVEADIKGFFDNVDHEWMVKFLQERIQDPNLLRLIRRFLKAGAMEEGKLQVTDKGTPQGRPLKLSPKFARNGVTAISSWKKM
ncbi:MAG TPA: reverse transcriptase domain-containing protein, partial [Negativicutes bacterium]